MDQKLDHNSEAEANAATAWHQVDWQQTERTVRNLRCRIYQAALQHKWAKVRSLMTLMLRSHSNRLVSVRKVTQVNAGKNTPGIDGEIYSSPKDRAKLVAAIQAFQPWKAKPVRRVLIPKANGKMRPLGIPTIRDRVVQMMVKNALEPMFEAQFETNSFGFRPGRCCQDAIDEIHAALNNSAVGRNQWILDADIKGAFDHISHAFVLNRIDKLPGHSLVKQWLKVGYVQWGKVHETAEGTPQGGVASPLLANIALDGLQACLGKGYRFVRYADDFVVMTKSREQLEKVIPKVVAFLKERGLQLNQEKTRMVHRTEGFKFLGFDIRMFGKKLLIKPQKEKVANFLGQIQSWLNKHKTVKTEDVIRHLNPILRGWANYYRYVVSKRTFRKASYRLYWMLWRWAKRRHPNKNTKWILAHYFEFTARGWVFCVQSKNRLGRNTKIHLVEIARTPILRHVKVKGTASPDDPNLSRYWQERRIKMGRHRFAKGSPLYQIAEGQGWKCPTCRQALFNGEPLDLDHIVPLSEGGTDIWDNKQWLHEGCHYQKHNRRVA